MPKRTDITRLGFTPVKGSALAAHKAFCPADFGSPTVYPPKSSAQRPCQCSLPRSRQRGFECWRNTQRLLTAKGRTYMYMNRVTLVGFTGAEAKHTTTQGGKTITRFSLATTKRYKSENEWKDNTQWHDCVVYNTPIRAAEGIQKGDHLLIEGELQYREYERTVETEEGSVNVQWPKTEIVVHSIVRLDRQSKARQRGRRIKRPLN